jgi:hypothetical protein
MASRLATTIWPRAMAAAGVCAALVLAVPGAAQSAGTGAITPGSTKADAACRLVASAAGDLRHGSSLRHASFTGGTHRADMWSMAGPTEPGSHAVVWCGFGGDDVVSDSWGWVYGGPGNDSMGENWLVFRGGPGNDSVSPNEGYFAGGPGNDTVIANHGTFDGGRGHDAVISTLGPPNTGTFNGGPGRDSVGWNAGTVRGGRGNDVVGINDGFVDGGPGFDVVRENHGTCVNVERGC